MLGPKFQKEKRGTFQYEIKCDNGKSKMAEGNMKILCNGVSVEKGHDKQMEKTNV